MTINVELFRRIDEAISSQPMGHSQAHFESHNSECGTARCVAGWALHVWGQDRGTGLRVMDLHEHYRKENPEAYRENELGIPVCGIADSAQHLLGLTESQANELFFNMITTDAARMVKEYASGKTDVQPCWTDPYPQWRP